MRKTIEIIDCDICGKELIKNHDAMYYALHKDMPGWASIYYMGRDTGTVMCEECFGRLVSPHIIHWEYLRDSDKEYDRKVREENKKKNRKQK